MYIDHKKYKLYRSKKYNFIQITLNAKLSNTICKITVIVVDLQKKLNY